MGNKIAVPRGTNDILPEEMPLWYEIESVVRECFNLYNYKEIRTPIFEDVGLFQRSLGATSDVVNKQLLCLASDKKEGFALRPEGTASIVRSYIENSMNRKEALSKLFYIGSMFRGERPQKGRLRQFHQIGAEVIGTDVCSPYLDADVIALSVNLLKSFGLNGFKLKINTLGSPEDKETFSSMLRGALQHKMLDLCEDCQDRFDRNVFRILDCKNKECRLIVENLDIGDRYLSQESRDYYCQVMAVLTRLGIEFEESPHLVRGLDYYTHTVFEISDPSLGSQDALGAGGRYNNLVSQLGGPKVDAIGFALGIERILLALGEDQKQALADPLLAYLIVLDENLMDQGVTILNELRSGCISADMSWKNSSMKSQMRQANKMGALNVVFIGADEMERGVVGLKNMETGEQEEISIKDQNFDLLIKKLH